jgi:hypothetical protein
MALSILPAGAERAKPGHLVDRPCPLSGGEMFQSFLARTCANASGVSMNGAVPETAERREYKRRRA